MNRSSKRRRGSTEDYDQVHFYSVVRSSNDHLTEASYYAINTRIDGGVETSYPETVVNDDDFVETSCKDHHIPVNTREGEVYTEFKSWSSILNSKVKREHISGEDIEHDPRNIVDGLISFEESDSDLDLGLRGLSSGKSHIEANPASVVGDEAERRWLGFADVEDEQDPISDEISDRYVALLRSRSSYLWDFSPQVVKEFQTQLLEVLEKTKIFDRKKYEYYFDVLEAAGKRRPLPEGMSTSQRNAEKSKRHRIRQRFALDDDKVLCRLTKKGELVPVATVLNTFGAIVDAHSTRMHAKVFTTHAVVAQHLYGVPEQLVTWLLARCSICMMKTKQVFRLSLKSISR